jgi:hypothetical protein
MFFLLLLLSLLYFIPFVVFPLCFHYIQFPFCYFYLYEWAAPGKYFFFISKLYRFVKFIYLCMCVYVGFLGEILFVQSSFSFQFTLLHKFFFYDPRVQEYKKIHSLAHSFSRSSTLNLCIILFYLYSVLNTTRAHAWQHFFSLCKKQNGQKTSVKKKLLSFIN